MESHFCRSMGENVGNGDNDLTLQGLGEVQYSAARLG